uniref:Uncharacterized protein n=1 Tax=Panagrolaimus sp. PS1159 TaxID=55785 RepID=A0AC35F2F7_9BILA
MRDFAAVDTEAYPVVKKAFKIHERPLLGFSYYYNPELDRNVLVSVANDSVKTWSIASFGDELDLMPLQEYNKIRCGSQAFDISPDGKCIIVVDTMNVLHVIREDEKRNLDGTIIDEGLMQILFCKFTPNKERIFSINFIRGMQAFDFDGQNVIREKLERKSSVSAVNFSPTGKYLGIGFDFGAFEIRNGETWELICRVEDIHKKKIRVVEFSHDDENILIGCDDKTLTLHTIFQLTTSKIQSFSYHLGPILSASIDYSQNSSQFCSASADLKVILWDAVNGTPLHIFQKCFDEQVVTAVNFSLNGRYLFSGTANGHIIVHKMSNFVEEPPFQEDIEMDEVKEVVEDYGEEGADFIPNDEQQFEISEDEEDVGKNLKDFDLSDSDLEDSAAKDEEEEEGETLASPAIVEDANDSAPASVKTENEQEENPQSPFLSNSNPTSVKTETEQNPQSPPLSPDNESEVAAEAEKSENGDIPMSPDE